MSEVSNEILSVLACEIDARPKDAPSIADVGPVLRNTEQVRGTLTLAFAPEHLSMVEAFASAERMCCREISWDVRGAPSFELRIAATDEQLDLLALTFAAFRQC